MKQITLIIKSDKDNRKNKERKPQGCKKNPY